VLWTGSDDGRVHVSRDGGANWVDVTPPDMPEAMVNAIDLSHRVPGRAYIAVTRYKFDDFTPMAWRTDDYGASWTSITDGIADEHWVRVVREDPVQDGLLYAGTEQGLYLSTDFGAHWQPFGLNLPRTPITDLTIQRERNDLVVATSGWGFWILDDLSGLQQWAGASGAAVDDAVGLRFFEPRPAIRVAGGGFGAGRGATVGRNPPDGAIFDLWVDQVPEGEVSLEVSDASGQVVRRLATEPDTLVGDGRLSLRPGLNRIAWNLRSSDLYRVPGLYVFGSTRGQRVPPGRYTVRVTGADWSLEQPLDVLIDPRVPEQAATIAEQSAFLADVRREIEALHRGVVELGAVRGDIDALVERLEGWEGEAAAAPAELGRALTRSLTEVEDSLVQWNTHDGQTVLDAPSRINFQYLILWGNAEGADSGITEGMTTLFDDLNARWWPLRDRLEQLLGPELDAFNEAVRELGMPAVARPAARAGTPPPVS
jgi:hypothetical protein